MDHEVTKLARAVALEPNHFELHMRFAQATIRSGRRHGGFTLGEALEDFLDPKSDKENRSYALKNLIHFEKAALPLLLDALENVHIRQRPRIIKSLGKFGPQARIAVPRLTKALESENKLVRRFAVQSLGRIGPHAKAAIPHLIAVAGDNSEGLRALAKIDINHDQCHQHLLNSTAHKDWSIAALAIEILSRGNQRCLLSLKELLGRDFSTTQSIVYHLLGRRLPHSFLEPLLNLLDNPKFYNCGVFAAQCIGGIGESALPTLKQLLGSKNLILRQRALVSLRCMGGAACALWPEILQCHGGFDDHQLVPLIQLFTALGTKARPAKNLILQLMPRLDQWSLESARKLLAKLENTQ